MENLLQESGFCSSCPFRACSRTGIWGGFEVVTDSPSWYGICPNSIKSKDEFLRFCSSLSSVEIAALHGMVSGGISAASRMQYYSSGYVADYTDLSGRIGMLCTLWENSYFAVIRNSASGNSYARLFNQSNAASGGGVASQGQKAVSPGPAATPSAPAKKSAFTDNPEKQKYPSFATTAALVNTPISNSLVITNPQWEHKDKTITNIRPNAVIAGDTILLVADVSGASDGASAVFDVFDAGLAPAMRITGINCSLERGKMRAEYSVPQGLSCGADSRRSIEFSASCRNVSSERRKIPVLVTVSFAEVCDVYFQNDGVIACLSQKSAFEAIIASVLKHVLDNPEHEMLICGHTDVSGDTLQCRQLSFKRACFVKAVIDRDRKTFVENAVSDGTVKDMQAILSALTSRYAWKCSPGAVDGIFGPKTRTAIEEFQKQYNSRFKVSIGVDGMAGRQTWDAVFDVYQDLIASSCRAGSINSSIAKLCLSYEKKNNGLIGCGSSFPLIDANRMEYQSKGSTRVEIFFLAPEEKTAISIAPPDSSEVTIANIPVFDNSCVIRRRVKDAPAAVVNYVAIDSAAEKKFLMPWYIDCHIHINSGHCTPLPLIWSKSGAIKATWKVIDIFGKSLLAPVLGDLGKVSLERTDVIGAISLDESDVVIQDTDLSLMGKPDERKRLLIAMPMDMHYAHYRGYENRPVYELHDGRPVYWDEAAGMYRNVSKTDYSKYETYDRQLQYTQTASVLSCGTILPFFHYDPRRWAGDMWSVPFNYIAGSKRDASLKVFAAIGFKLYTALGYKPADPKLPELDKFFGKCESEDVPVVCHCSPGGMTAHDYKIYFQREKPGVKASDSQMEKYFYDEFVSPFAWRDVLKKHPKLRLCLAHFGGVEHWGKQGRKYWADGAITRSDKDNWIACLLQILGSKEYPNVYVDLSYFMFDEYVRTQFAEALEYDSERIKHRIVFGTDWYMIAQEGEYGSSIPLPSIKSKGYHKYFCDMYSNLLKINNSSLLKNLKLKSAEDLLGLFMLINPVRFLRLKKVAPEMERIHSLIAPATGIKTFRLTKWLDKVPETVEGLRT